MLLLDIRELSQPVSPLGALQLLLKLSGRLLEGGDLLLLGVDGFPLCLQVSRVALLERLDLLGVSLQGFANRGEEL